MEKFRSAESGETRGFEKIMGNVVDKLGIFDKIIESEKAYAFSRFTP